MEKVAISIVFLAILYLFKIAIDYFNLQNDPYCIDFYEKFQDSKATYLFAIPISYVFCLVGAYKEWIAKLYCADFINSIIIIAGFLTVPFLIIQQNNRKTVWQIVYLTCLDLSFL